MDASADSSPSEARGPRLDRPAVPHEFGGLLQSGEDPFRRLLLALPAAVYATDAEGRITLFNDRAAELWGRRPTLGEDLWCGSWRIFHPDGTPMPHEECPMAVALRERRPVQGAEIVVERPDGTRAHVLPSPQPLFDGAGELIGAVNMLVDVTPQKQVERDRALLAAIVESSGDAIVSKTLDGTITSWNAGAERLFGYAAEEAVGTSVLRLIPPERQEEEDLILGRIRRGERVEHFDTVRVTKDGRLIHVSLTISPVRDAAGRIIGASKVARDISERKRAEAALHESELRFHALADNAPVLIWVSDAENRGTYFNRRWLEFTGRTMEQERDFGWTESVHPEDRAETAAVCQRHFDARAEFRLEFRLRHHGGAYRWVHDYGVPRYTADGTFLGYIGACFDIDDRKRSEYILADARRRAEEAERQIRSLIDHLPELAWWAQPDGRIDFFNRRWFEYTGTTPEDMEEEGWQKVHDPEVLPEVAERWQHTLGTGEPFEMEFPLRGADGSFRWFLTRVQPIRDRAGRIVRWVGINVDIHDKRRAETQSRFLARSGALVEQTLDAEATLGRLAALAVPGFADWCAIDLLRDDGAIEAVALAHADPDKVKWGWALREQYPVDPDAPTGAPNVIRTGRAELYPDIPDELIEAVVETEEERRLIREIGYSSVIVVPVKAGGTVVGTITYANTSSGRHFDEADLATAEEVGRRAGAALETARLHAAVRENAERLRAVIDTAVDGIITIDEGGLVESVNPAVVTIFGYTPEEVLGQNVRMLMPEPYHSEHDGYLARYLQTGERRIIGIGREVHGRRKDGSTFPMELAVSETYLGGRRIFTGLVRDITERKQAEAALQESEARFRAISELTSDFAYAARRTDTGGFEREWVSGAYRRITGYDPAELDVDEPWRKLVHPDDVEAGERRLDALRKGEAGVLEFRLVAKDGAVRWVRDYARPELDAEGRVVRVVGAVQDITEQQEAQEALRESERRFRALFSSIDEGYCLGEVILDADGTPVDYRFLEVNPLFESMTGLIDAKGRTALELVPDLEPHWIETYAGVALGTETLRFESGSDAMGRWFDVFATPVEPYGRFALVFNDITERKRAEQALRESERRFRHIAEALPQIVYILPAERTGDTEYLNPQWYAYTGMPPGTSYADAAPGVVHPDDAPRVRAMWAAASETGDLVEMEIRLRRHDGQYRWFLTRLVPVTDAEGRILRWFGTSTDIHAQKAAEAELTERVTARTVELERSNQELDQFAYVASHDLKAPLRAIDNLAAWIAEDAGPLLPEPSREHLDLLQGRVQRMEDLLDSLLTYSRAGRHVGMAEPVDTADLALDVVRMLDPPDTFTVEVDEAMPTLVTYRAPLELVVRNLLGNAVKHSGSGGRVRIAAHDAGGAFLTFSVADDGPGIAPQYHERIFGLFQTLRPRDEVEGSGMGLSVVKKTVESLGGTIRVDSAEGEGATFTFTWPRTV